MLALLSCVMRGDTFGIVTALSALPIWQQICLKLLIVGPTMGQSARYSYQQDE
jgi:hypothetical protein